MYDHVKAHLDEQYGNYLKCIDEKKKGSSCCICNHNLIGNSVLNDQTDAKSLVKTHFEAHIQQLKDYMLKKVIIGINKYFITTTK